MANPTLTKYFDKPTAGAASADATLQAAPPGALISDGTTMEIGGTAAKTGFLLLLVLTAGAWGWSQTDPAAGETGLPWFLWVALIGVVVLAVITAFQPKLARVTGPLYALTMGAFVGSLSRAYSTFYDGIVLQAILATAAVFVVMLVLFTTRTIKVTNRLRSTVIGATFGIALFYLASIVLSLFGADMPFVWDSGFFGIAFSVFVVGVAAFNLLLDFDLIERGVAAGAPKYMEWYGAFGLMVTIIWMYLEILRLLAKLRE